MTVRFEPLPQKYNLTDQQKDILCLVRDGFLNKQIALKLNLSETTVKHQLERIYDILKVDNRISAVLKAIATKLITAGRPDRENLYGKLGITDSGD